MALTAQLSVCTTCEGGVALADVLAERVPVQRVACMNVCDRPACLAVRDEGKAAYLFGDVSAGMAAEVETFLELFNAAAGGIVDDARPLGKLRFCLIGRIPA